MEGDSAMTIQELTKILGGTHPDKVSSNWRLEAKFFHIASMSYSITNINPAHVRIKGNRLADRLANEAVTMETQEILLKWESLGSNQLKEDCKRIDMYDNVYLYGGDNTGKHGASHVDGKDITHPQLIL